MEKGDSPGFRSQDWRILETANLIPKKGIASGIKMTVTKFVRYNQRG